MPLCHLTSDQRWFPTTGEKIKSCQWCGTPIVDRNPPISGSSS